MTFFTKLRKIVKYYKQFCLAKAAKSRLEESRLRQHLEFWQVILHSDTANGTTKARIKILRDKLQSLANQKEEGRKIRSRTRWMESGDRMSKHFFSSVRERPAGGLITELYDEDNTIASSSANLAKVCNSFYSKLYACPVQNEQRHEHVDELLSYVPKKFSPTAQRMLEAPLTSEELTKAVQALAKGKSPGPDGLTAEFFQSYWSFMCDNFTRMVNESLARGRFPNGVTRGKIALLFKEGDHSRLTNWRPITLLNITYKIFAKALQRRLQPLLVEVIDSDQTAFLPLRFILDNILLTYESI